MKQNKRFQSLGEFIRRAANGRELHPPPLRLMDRRELKKLFEDAIQQQGQTNARRIGVANGLLQNLLRLEVLIPSAVGMALLAVVVMVKGPFASSSSGKLASRFPEVAPFAPSIKSSSKPIVLLASNSRSGEIAEQWRIEIGLDTSLGDQSSIPLKQAPRLASEGLVRLIMGRETFEGLLVTRTNDASSVTSFQVMASKTDGNVLQGELRLVRLDDRNRIESEQDLTMAIFSGKRRLAGKEWERVPETIFQPAAQ